MDRAPPQVAGLFSTGRQRRNRCRPLRAAAGSGSPPI